MYWVIPVWSHEIRQVPLDRDLGAVRTSAAWNNKGFFPFFFLFTCFFFCALAIILNTRQLPQTLKKRLPTLACVCYTWLMTLLWLGLLSGTSPRLFRIPSLISPPLIKKLGIELDVIDKPNLLTSIKSDLKKKRDLGVYFSFHM